MNETISQHLSFRGSCHTLPADRLRVYHSLQGRQLSFRSSSHTLLADSLRVYHSPKRRVLSGLSILGSGFGNLHSLVPKRLSTRITRTLKHHPLGLATKISEKVGKTAYPVKRSTLFTVTKFG